MNEIWIVNASPIIVLAKAGLHELPLKMGQTVVVPEAVCAEVRNGPVDDPARRLLETSWGTVAAPTAEIPTSLLEWGLGTGETAVIALALERPGAVAVLDDAVGRHCAQAFRLPVIGTLGILLRAKRAGLISSAAAAINAIRACGLHLDDQTIAIALSQFDRQ